MNKFRPLTNNITKKIPSMASATAVMTALVVVLYLFFFQDFSETRLSLHDADERQDDSHIAPTSQISRQRHFWSKCVRNNSVERISGFDALPDHIKNFLYYQHCRHFPMLLDTPHKCGGPKGSAKVFLLLVIKSSPMNYDRREVLRNTWAKERLQNGVWIRRLFISGTQDDGYNKKRLNRLLALEQHKYNDILQWDFHDSFFNLTLKQILFLEWMDRNCPHVRFMLNGDDDVFAHTDNMILYLQNLPDNNGGKHLYAGDVIKAAKPIRSPASKYYIPTQVHNSGPYPAYCGGGGFLLSGYTALIMYNMSHSIPLLPIDDVYLAMCLDKAGLHPESHLGVKTSGLYIPDVKADRYDPCYFREMLLVHRFLSVNMYVMWHDIQNPDLNCSPSSVL